MLAWTGMRGVVTLAAAAGVPLFMSDGSPFPGREAIVSLAFLVTIATLLIQGLTLPWLIGRLKLEDPDHERFLAVQRDHAEALTRGAAIEALDDYARSHTDTDSTRLIGLMRARLLQDQKLEKPLGIDPQQMMTLSRLLSETRRTRLVNARDSLELDDTVVREMLEKLDLEQAFMDSLAE